MNVRIAFNEIKSQKGLYCDNFFFHFPLAKEHVNEENKLIELYIYKNICLSIIIKLSKGLLNNLRTLVSIVAAAFYYFSLL